MEKNAFTNAMDRMLGYSPEAIGAYLGKAALSLPCLKVYIRRGGCIAITFAPNISRNMEPEANGYVIYDRSGSVLHAQGVTPVAMEPAMLDGAQNPLEVADKYGAPHADIGSGVSRFAYLSDHGTLYSVELQGKTACVIRERSLLQA